MVFVVVVFLGFFCLFVLFCYCYCFCLGNSLSPLEKSYSINDTLGIVKENLTVLYIESTSFPISTEDTHLIHHQREGGDGTRKSI